jgi:hypothetical protein
MGDMRGVVNLPLKTFKPINFRMDSYRKLLNTNQKIEDQENDGHPEAEKVSGLIRELKKKNLCPLPDTSSWRVV